MMLFDAEYFHPKDTLECGQLFRYKRLDENDYMVYSLDRCCRVTKKQDKVILDTSSPEYFANYFDLSTDYRQINHELLAFEELKDAALLGKGIRILRQNLYECIISFILSANNNIPRIKGIIEKLCAYCGEDKQDYYAFPSLERMCELTCSELRCLGAGFRDKYLMLASRKMLESDFLTALLSSGDEEAFSSLCSLDGVGAKVANCVMLFGLGRLSRFPVDVWMTHALKTSELDSPRKISSFYSSRYGEYAGVAQQYIFYYTRKNN